MTYRGPELAPRREVPVHDAWRRLIAPEQRKQMLEAVFSAERMGAGQIFGIVGPSGAGKSAVALAVADRRGYRASFASLRSDDASFRPREGLCVVVDPVSAFPQEVVAGCVDAFAGISPVILIDRDEDVVRPHVGEGAAVVRLKLPSAAAIAAYMSSLLRDYPNALTADDFAAWARQMAGMNLHQINAVTVDAALLRMQLDAPVDSAAISEALDAYRRVQERISDGPEMTQ